MPVYDWTRVSAGGFHDFHQDWTIEIRRTLNRGLLPPGYAAYSDLRVEGYEPDVVSIDAGGPHARGGQAVAEVPPSARQVAQVRTEAAAYALRANRISIRHEFGRVVAIIEIVSPGNKESKYDLDAFLAKSVAFLRRGVNLLIIDLFPPTRRDPQGPHQAIWGLLTDEPFALRPEDKPLTVAGYDTGDPLTADDPLPDAPLFLAPGWYVSVPLERTYITSWEATPEPIRDRVAPGEPRP
jgi:hypothetical protein